MMLSNSENESLSTRGPYDDTLQPPPPEYFGKRPPLMWQHNSSVKCSPSSPLTTSPSVRSSGIIMDSNSISCNTSSPLAPVELQISNIDQSIDAREMKKILLNFFREHVMVLHVSMLVQNDGNLAASLKVPTSQDAQYAISQLHRMKIGNKRIAISYVNHNQPSPAAKRSKAILLLQEVPGKNLPLFKFRELYEKRYHETIGVSDMYNMRDIVTVSDNNTGRMVNLNLEFQNFDEKSLFWNDPHGVSRFCTKHTSKPDSNIGWAERDNDVCLPNVNMSLRILSDNLPLLLNSHNGVIPLASLVDCYTAECEPIKEVPTTGLPLEPIKEVVTSGVPLEPAKEVLTSGVPLEHLASCLPFVSIDTSGDGFKFLQWSENVQYQDELEELSRYVSPALIGQLTLFSRELVDLLKTFPHTRLPFSRFIPAYHHHFGRQCRVADYGFTKLADLLDALPHIVQILGDGNKKSITLAHKAQMKRFSSDLTRVLKTKPAKLIMLSEFPSAYQKVTGKPWDVTDYGVCYTDDLLDEINDSTILVTKEGDDVILEIPKRDQTPDEMERTTQFGIEVIELLKHSPRCMMQFNRFIPAYHHHFGRQCRVSNYGFTKLIELFEALSTIVEVFDDEDGEKQVQLVEKERTKVLGNQITLVIEGAPRQTLSIDSLSKVYTHYFGYSLRPELYGHPNLISLLESLDSFIKVSCDGDKNDVPVVTLVDRAYLFKELSRIRTLLWKEKTCSASLEKLMRLYKEKWNSEPDVSLFNTGVEQYFSILKNSGDSSTIKLDDVQIFARDLLTVLEEAGGKMLVTNFESAYKEKFGIQCKPAKLGYASIVSLMQSLCDLVNMRGRGSRKLLLLNSGDQKALTDSDEEEKSNLVDGLKDMNLDGDLKSKYDWNLTKLKKNVENDKVKSGNMGRFKRNGFKEAHEVSQTKVVVETIRCTSVTSILDSKTEKRVPHGPSDDFSGRDRYNGNKNRFQKYGQSLSAKSFHVYNNRYMPSFDKLCRKMNYNNETKDANDHWNSFKNSRWHQSRNKQYPSRNKSAENFENYHSEIKEDFDNYEMDFPQDFSSTKELNPDGTFHNDVLMDDIDNPYCINGNANGLLDMRPYELKHVNDNNEQKLMNDEQQGIYDVPPVKSFRARESCRDSFRESCRRDQPNLYRKSFSRSRKMSTDQFRENGFVDQSSPNGSIPVPNQHGAQPVYDYLGGMAQPGGVIMNITPPPPYQSPPVLIGSPVNTHGGPGSPSVVWGQIWSPQFPTMIAASPISPHYVIPPGLAISWGNIAGSPPTMNLPTTTESGGVQQNTISIHTLNQTQPIETAVPTSSQMPPLSNTVSASTPYNLPQFPSLYDLSFPVSSPASFPVSSLSASMDGFSMTECSLSSSPLTTSIAPIISPDLGVEIAPLTSTTYGTCAVSSEFIETTASEMMSSEFMNRTIGRQ